MSWHLAVANHFHLNRVRQCSCSESGRLLHVVMSTHRTIFIVAQVSQSPASDKNLIPTEEDRLET